MNLLLYNKQIGVREGPYPENVDALDVCAAVVVVVNLARHGCRFDKYIIVHTHFKMLCLVETTHYHSNVLCNIAWISLIEAYPVS